MDGEEEHFDESPHAAAKGTGILFQQVRSTPYIPRESVSGAKAVSHTC